MSATSRGYKNLAGSFLLWTGVLKKGPLPVKINAWVTCPKGEGGQCGPEHLEEARAALVQEFPHLEIRHEASLGDAHRIFMGARRGRPCRVPGEAGHAVPVSCTKSEIARLDKAVLEGRASSRADALRKGLLAPPVNL